MEKEFPKHSKKVVLTCLALLWAGMHGTANSQESKISKKEGQEAKQAKDKKTSDQMSMEMNGGPSPLYLVVMKQWATTTNYASDSATVIVQKLKLAMEADPAIKKIVTPAFIADLQQFIYELFISNDAIMELAKVYSQYFSIDEMQDLLAFYNTPLGKKLVKAEPQLVIKTQEVGMNLLKKNQRAYMELIAKHTGKPITSKEPAASASTPESSATTQTPPAAQPSAPSASQPVAKPEPFKPETTQKPEAQPAPKPEVAPPAPAPSKPALHIKPEQPQPSTPKLPSHAKPVKPEQTWWERLRSMIGV